MNNLTLEQLADLPMDKTTDKWLQNLRDAFNLIFDENKEFNKFDVESTFNPNNINHNEVVENAWKNILNNIGEANNDTLKCADEFNKMIGKISKKKRYWVINRLALLTDFVEYWKNIEDIRTIEMKYKDVEEQANIGEINRKSKTFSGAKDAYFAMIKRFNNNKCIGHNAKFFNWDKNIVDILEKDNSLINYKFEYIRLKSLTKAFDKYCIPYEARRLLTEYAPRAFYKTSGEMMLLDKEYINIERPYHRPIHFGKIRIQLVEDHGLLDDEWDTPAKMNKDLNFEYVWEGFNPNIDGGIEFNKTESKYFYNVWSKDNLPKSITTIKNDTNLRKIFMDAYGYSEADMAARDIIGKRLKIAVDVLFELNSGYTWDPEKKRNISDGFIFKDYQRYGWQYPQFKIKKTYILSGWEGAGKTSLADLSYNVFNNNVHWNPEIKAPDYCDLPINNILPDNTRLGYAGFERNVDGKAEFSGEKNNTVLMVRDEAVGNSRHNSGTNDITEDAKIKIESKEKTIHKKGQGRYQQRDYDNYIDVTNHHLDITPGTGWSRRTIYSRCDIPNDVLIPQMDAEFKKRCEQEGLATDDKNYSVLGYVKNLSPFYLEYIVDWLEEPIRPEFKKKFDNELEVHTDSKGKAITDKISGNNFGQTLKEIWRNAKYDRVLAVISDPYCFQAANIFRYAKENLYFNNEQSFYQELLKYGLREVNKDDFINETPLTGNKLNGYAKGKAYNVLNTVKYSNEPGNAPGSIQSDKSNCHIYSIKKAHYNIPDKKVSNDDDIKQIKPPQRDILIGRGKSVSKCFTIANPNNNEFLKLYKQVQEEIVDDEPKLK